MVEETSLCFVASADLLKAQELLIKHGLCLTLFFHALLGIAD